MHFWRSRRERNSLGRVRTLPFFFRLSRKSSSAPGSVWPAKVSSLPQICTSSLKTVRRKSSKLLITLGLVDGPAVPVKLAPETAVKQESIVDATRAYINDLDGHSGSDTGKSPNGYHLNPPRIRKRKTRKAPALPLEMCSSSTIDRMHSSDPGPGNANDQDPDTPPSSVAASSYHFSEQTTQTVIRRPILAPKPSVLPQVESASTSVNEVPKDLTANDVWASLLTQISSNPVPSNGLPPIPEVGALCIPVCRPRCSPLASADVSIYTVEVSAAAKIYLEARFSSILSKNDAKIQNSQLFDEHLRETFLSPEGCREERARWIATESENLRLFRALRSHARRSRHRFISDYEKVRILGKGSFGTVQLIRHKESVNDLANDASSIKTTESLDLKTLRKQVFAMKIIRKSDMLRKSQEGHLRAERDFLVASERSHWVVPLIESFQDTEHLYLVMEYMVGGDFLGLLLRLEILPESMTQFYIAEMVLCVEEIHRMRWIHRDVKPDNFLLSSSGHLKVSDFGLAFDGHWAHNQKYHNETRYSIADRLGITIRGDDRDSEEARAEQIGMLSGAQGKPARADEFQRPEGNLLLDNLNAQWKRRLARTVVGTSQYMAPEVIQGLRYDGRCDWWSIGVILYECLYGRTPFLSENREETKLKISHHVPPLSFPAIQRRQSLPGNRYTILPPVSAEANALINALLSPRESRLSSRKYRDNDVQQSRTTRRAAANGNGNGGSGNGAANTDFVFANDAKDIKRHPFFRGVEWESLHTQVPPFIPRIREDQSITKYFEDEKDILGSESESVTSIEYSECCAAAAAARADGVPERVAAALPGLFARSASAAGGGGGEAFAGNEEDARAALEWLAKHDARALRALWKRSCGGDGRRPPLDHMRQEQREQDPPAAAATARKRARDKILRDPKMYRTAMHVRKRYAFMGYTYRRPHYVRRAGRPAAGGAAARPGSVVSGASARS